MNMKLKKLLNDIQKTEDKIAELQEHLKRQNTLRQQMEDIEIVKSFRSMKLDSRNLLVLLDGIQKGTVTIQMDEMCIRDRKQAVRDAKKNAKKKKSRPVAAPSGQRPAGKVVSGTKGSGTGKKTPDSARDKRITAQQSIPYHEMGRDGICRVQDKFYSKTIRFYDINYQLAQNEDKNAIFENWCDFLNYFDSTIHFQLSFINQHSNMAEYEKVIHINPQEDAFDDLRMEFAQMLNSCRKASLLYRQNQGKI